MRLILYLGDFLMPLIIFYIVGMGIGAKLNVYETFIEGVKDGFHIVVKIAPTLVGLMVAVGVLRASGVLEYTCNLIRPAVSMVHIPIEVLPVFLVRIFSSSAANGLLLDIFKELGPDSVAGRMAAVSLSCTEALFYSMSIYFASIGIRNTRWTLPGALVATCAGIVASVVVIFLL